MMPPRVGGAVQGTEQLDKTRLELEAFVAEHHAGLVRYLHRRTGDPALAEDLAHDALEKLVHSWDTVSTMDHRWSWLRTVAVNLSISTWRRTSAYERSIHALGHEANRHPLGDETSLSDLVDMIDRLPDRQRRVILLRHLLHLSVHETAKVLGWPPGTVKSTTARALESLRTRASDAGHGLEGR